MEQIEMKPEDYRVEGMRDAGGPGGEFGGPGEFGGEDMHGRPIAFAGRETFLDRADMVIVFLALFGAFFIAETLMGGAANIGVLIALGANYGSFVDRGEFWRLVTANFLHGGFMHIFVNGYSFYILGRFVERIYGRTRLSLVFLCTAILAAFVSWQANGVVSVGASGGITGLLGLLTAFTLRYREKLDPRFRSNFLSNLLFIVGINVFISLMDPRIDNWAHAGGFAAGLVFGLVFFPAVLFQRNSTVPYLRWGAYAGVFVVLAAFSAQTFAFVFTTLIPDKGPFRVTLVAEGSVHLAYPFFFEIEKVGDEDEIRISNHSNHALLFRLLDEEDAHSLVRRYVGAGGILEEGLMNGQKTMRVSGAMESLVKNGKRIPYGVGSFYIAAPYGSPHAGAWAELSMYKEGRQVGAADLRLLDACARKIFFTTGGVI